MNSILSSYIKISDPGSQASIRRIQDLSRKQNHSSILHLNEDISSAVKLVMPGAGHNLE